MNAAMKRSQIAAFSSLSVHAAILLTFALSFAPEKTPSFAAPRFLELGLSSHRTKAVQAQTQKKTPASPRASDTIRSAQSAPSRADGTELNAYLARVWNQVEGGMGRLSHSRVRDRALSGSLKVRLTLLPSGKVNQIEFLPGEDSPELRAMTLEAIRHEELPRFPAELASLHELKVVLSIEASQKPSKPWQRADKTRR